MLKWTYRPRRPSSALSLTALMNGLTLLLVVVLVSYRGKMTAGAGDNRLPVVSSLPAGMAALDLGSSLNIVIGEHSLRVGHTDVPVSGDGVSPAFVEAIVKERMRDGRIRRQILVQAEGQVPYRRIDRVITAASSLGMGRIRFVALDGEAP